MPFELRENTKETIIKHFAKKKINFDEESLINVMKESQHKYDVYWAVIGLRGVGTYKCIPYLKSLKNFPKQDVKDCLLLTIAHISGAKETPFYVEVLTEKGTKKDYAMWAIKDCADERALQAVINYLVEVFKKWRQPKCIYVGDAYTDGLIYLSRYYDKEKSVKDVFEKYLQIKDKIPVGAKERLSKEVSCFVLDWE